MLGTDSRVLAFLCCLAVLPPASAGAPPRQSLADTQRKAEHGDPISQNRLGEMYSSGDSVDQDKQAALGWFRKAAHLGNPDAMCNLGVAYYNGAGVSTNDSLSLAWFLAAQRAGCDRATDAVQRAQSQLRPWDVLRAYNQLAEMYHKGEELPKDEKEAIRWWRMSASNGDVDAQIALAVTLLSGREASLDAVEGRHWCDELEKKHDPRGAYCLGYIAQKGLGEAMDLPRARRYYSKASEGHYLPAMRLLAGMEANGEGGKIDRVSASVLYARVASTGERDALQPLAVLRTQMSADEWKKVRKELLLLKISPQKLEADLQRAYSQ